MGKRLMVSAWLLTFGLWGFAQEKDVEKILDFQSDRGSVAWENLEKTPVPLDAANEDQSVVKVKEAQMDTGEENVGIVSGDALFIKAKPVSGKQEYGVAGQYVISLPAHRYLQFQCGAEIVSGYDKGADLLLQIETRSKDGQTWEFADALPAKGIGKSEKYPGSCYIVEELTEWAGQQVRLSLVLRVNPSYAKVGAQENWDPQEIGATIFMAKLISSTFKVVVGEKEEKADIQPVNPNSLPKKSSTNAPIPNVKASVSIVSPINADELVIAKGDANGYLANPSDLSTCAVEAPGNGTYPTRFVYYFSARRSAGHEEHGGSSDVDSPDWEYGASSRMVDFYNASSTNMYNASVNDITGHIIKNATGEAIQVIGPSGNAARDFDDHWTGLSSVLYNELSDTTKTLHGFYYAEDHFQHEEADNNRSGAGSEHNAAMKVYAGIGYSRSSGTGYGRVFMKTNSLVPEISNPQITSSSAQIITYATPEEQINFGYPGNNQFGCGDPSVVNATDGFYYMAFTTQSLLLDWPNKVPQLFVYPDDYEVTSCNGYDYCGHKSYAMISMARAPISAIHSTSYSSNTNPWKKYKKATTPWNNDNNWVQPGYRGEFTAVWNADPNHDDLPDAQFLWRANPKLSYNTYLNKYVIICKGGMPPNKNWSTLCIHISDNPVEWQESWIHLREEYPNSYIHYPTLIGSTGVDYTTTEYNKLYFSIKSATEEFDLYRTTLRFIQ